MATQKVWWKSWTLWANLLAVLGTFVVGKFVTAAQWGEITTVVLGVTNIVLRMKTDSGLVGGSGPESVDTTIKAAQDLLSSFAAPVLNLAAGATVVTPPNTVPSPTTNPPVVSPGNPPTTPSS